MAQVPGGMDTCAKSGNGNCQRDVDPTYDGSGCDCVPCPNVVLCGQWMPRFFLLCHGGFCFGCATTWGIELDFRTMQDVCSVCLQDCAIGVRHPSECAGGHVFCVACTRQLYWGVDDSSENEEELWGADTRCPVCRS